ncbi:zinc finger, CCHC-type containing protein [Tanacetum coccineum]
MNMDEAIQVSCIIDKLPPSWKDFKHTLKHPKEELTLVELGSYLHIEESLKVQDNDKPKGNNVAGPLVVNMVEHNNSSRYTDNRAKRKHHDNTKADPNKKSKVTCWKCGKPGHLNKDCKGGKVGNKANGLVDGSTNSLKGATVHVCKDRCWFKIYESLNDGSILHMGNHSTTMVHDETLDKFKVFKTKIELQQGSLIKRFRIDRGGLSQGFWGEAMLTACYLLNKVLNKRNKITPYELRTKKKPNLNYLRVWGCRAVVRLPDPKLKTLGERGIECIFIRYAEHSKAFRFYLIEPNESVLINSIIESRDAIFNKNRFSSVPRPSLRIPNRTEDIGGLVVPEKATEEVVVQQPKPGTRKGKRNRNPKNFGPEFELYLIEGTEDEVFDQHSYCFNVEDDPKTFDKAMKSQDVANHLVANGSSKKTEVACISTIRLLIALASIYSMIIHQMDIKTTFLNGELNEEVYMNQPQGFIMLDNENKVNLTKEFLSSRFSIKDMGEADIILCIRIKHESNGISISQSHYIENALKKFNYLDCSPVSTPMDTSEKLMPNNGQAISQLEYSRASKKQTCITSSTMEYEFVAVAAAKKEAEWLRNLIFEISLWSKPIAPKSILCDSATTLARAYSQMYNGKSRHLANERPPMLEKGNYIPWESRFKRFLDNKLKEGDQMWRSIKKGPYKRPMIPNPDNIMNYLLQAIPNDIYNSVDACKNAKDMWERIKRLMYGSDITSHVRHSRLMDEFDKFAAKEGELLESLYEILTTLVNIMDRNNVRPIPVSINTKFLNFLQPEWSKYVTMYQGELQGDSQEDKLTTAMMLLARAITQKFSTPTNNCLFTSSKTRNQAVIQNGRVDIQTKNACYGGNGNRNAWRQNMNQEFNVGNGNDEILMMARIQPADENADSKPSYDAKAVSEINASNKVHEQVNHAKRKTIIHTSDDDQIDSNIIFDDLYVENNGGRSKHDSNAHDEYHDIQILAYNVQREVENQKRLNNELKKQKELLQKELETYKDPVKTFE